MWSVWGACVRSDAGLWEETQMKKALGSSHWLVAQQDTQYKLGACSRAMDTMSRVCKYKGRRLAKMQLIKGDILEKFWVKR